MFNKNTTTNVAATTDAYTEVKREIHDMDNVFTWGAVVNESTLHKNCKVWGAILRHGEKDESTPNAIGGTSRQVRVANIKIMPRAK